MSGVVYVFKSRFLKAALWGCKPRSDSKLVRDIPDSWSVGCFRHRLGILSLLIGLALVSMTVLLHL